VYEADVISPITGLTSHLSYTLGASKAWTYVWDTTVVPVWGVETVLPFTLKYTSGGAPVTNATLVSASITGGGPATVKQELVDVDRANGIYGVKVTPGALAATAVSVTVKQGNLNTTLTLVRNFTPTAGATVTMAAMAAATRTIGIKLVGATSGDVITAVSGGAIMDAAVGGPWTPTANGVIFVPLPASNRNRPVNTNTTPSTVDTIAVTYTRGGQTYTVNCAVTVFWLHAKVTNFTLTSNLLQFSGNVAGAASTWTFGQCTFLSETGTSLGTNGTTPVNNVATDGKVYWNLNTRLADQRYVSFTGSGSFSGSTFYYWTDPFDIARVPYMVMTSTEWNFTIAQTDAGKNIDLPDIIRTFKDDHGVPLTGLSLNTIPGVDGVSGWRNIFQPRIAAAGDWSTVLVPVTDGSDGQYYVRLSQTGRGFTNWWVTVFSSTFVFNTNEYGPMSLTFGSRIN
jgi:hypothetical protein